MHPRAPWWDSGGVLMTGTPTQVFLSHPSSLNCISCWCQEANLASSSQLYSRNRQILLKNICFLIYDPISLWFFGDTYNYTQYDSCHRIASSLAIFFLSLQRLHKEIIWIKLCIFHSTEIIKKEEKIGTIRHHFEYNFKINLSLWICTVETIFYTIKICFG